MGGNILTNLVGYQGDQCFLEAACAVGSPVNQNAAGDCFRHTAFGFYNCILGQKVNEVLMKHEPYLAEHFKKKINVDIKKTIASNPWSLWKFDDTFTAPYYGYKSQVDYYNQCSAHHRLPNVKVPLLLLNAMDDPLIGEKGPKSAFDIIAGNENLLMGMTKHGGHVAYFESALDL